MHRILIIENNTTQICPWISFLKGLGHDYHIAMSNDEIEESLDAFVPTIIFIQTNSNDPQCLELISALKNHKNAAPMVVFSKGKDFEFIVKTIKLVFRFNGNLRNSQIILS